MARNLTAVEFVNAHDHHRKQHVHDLMKLFSDVHGGAKTDDHVLLHYDDGTAEPATLGRIEIKGAGRDPTGAIVHVTPGKEP